MQANNVDFSTIKITLKKVSENNVDFSTREITSKKARGNNVDFSTSEITPEKARRNRDVSPFYKRDIKNFALPSYERP